MLSQTTTEQKEAEQKMKDCQERITMINEKLRLLSSTTRHDINNKLSAIPAYSYLLKKKLADQPDIIEKLVRMEQAVKEVEKILQFAKVYEQLGVEKLVEINAAEAIDQAIVMSPDLSFKVVNNCQGLSILADSFFKQLACNLIDNTKKHGQKTTTLKIHYEKPTQDNLNLIFEDDGIGIPFENKEQLFKRGFSTGNNSGYGLFMSKNIIELYGWSIQETGKPGEGAKFIIAIPKLNKNGQVNYQIRN
jgi:signal transduction histidine kinase